jgi:hypothetical protein
MDWKRLAENFEVTLPFLLQQAAWLYDRQLSQVREQMRRVGNSHANSPLPAPGSASGSAAIGGQAAKLVSSNGTRGPSRLQTLQKESFPSRAESSPTTSTRHKVTPSVRTNSTATVTQGKARRGSSPRGATTVTIKEREATGRGTPVNMRERPALAILQRSPKFEEESPSLSSSDESDSDSDQGGPNRRVPGFKRFGKFSMHKPVVRDDDQDEDEPPAFLPFPSNTSPPTREVHGNDPNDNLHQAGDHTELQRRRTTEYAPTRRLMQSGSLTSSASSGGAVGTPQMEGARRPVRPSAPLSGQRPSGLSRLSPQQLASGKESSEETPSMGSSFSDLDDASVTQSALEEALLSNMQQGGMASRMSTISQALRSRYL